MSLLLLVLLVVFSLSIYFNSNVPFCFFREILSKIHMHVVCISYAFLRTFEKYMYFALKGMHFSSKYMYFEKVHKKCIRDA